MALLNFSCNSYTSSGRNALFDPYQGLVPSNKSLLFKSKQKEIELNCYNRKFITLHAVKLTSQMVISETENESKLEEASKYIPSAPILLPQGGWTEVEGGVNAPSGFRSCGLYAGLRASGVKPDLSLVVCEKDAVVAGTFTKNVMAAAPVLYCKKVLESSNTTRAVLTNAGQANAATGDAGYADTEECAQALAKVLNINSSDVMILSTGVIGKRIKKQNLLSSLPKLVSSLTSTPAGSGSSAVAITTTDLVSKSCSIQTEIDGQIIKIGGMAKGSGMIHPNMATMLSVITCDANITCEMWRKMVSVSVNRSFNQITVDGDTSTNDTVIALSSCMSTNPIIDSDKSQQFEKLQAALDALCQGLAKSIAWDGEGATCLIEVDVSGAEDEHSASVIAKSVASSSLTKAAIYGRDPNWGRIACAAGYAGIDFDQNQICIKLGPFDLMQKGQPLDFDANAASAYLTEEGKKHGTVVISINLGSGEGRSKAWGCDLSYDYVKINAEYTT